MLRTFHSPWYGWLSPEVVNSPFLLYTKRQFRCDCGTSRLASNTCTLNKSQEKKEDGTENKYNQNFNGVYCTCSRPYPDPEDPEPDQMIQCIVCEDWYHGRHLWLKNGPPNDSDYGEMICVTDPPPLPPAPSPDVLTKAKSSQSSSVR